MRDAGTRPALKRHDLAAHRPMPDARRVLREETRSLHDRAERALGDTHLREMSGYIHMLRSNLIVTQAVARAAAPHLQAWLTLGLERDCGRLRADLADLGATCTMPAVRIEIGDAAGAMGAVYVMEGARLGGRVLARQVRTSLDLTDVRGAAYLNGEGDASGARWRHFVEALNAGIVSPGDIDRALGAARSTFGLIISTYGEA